MLSYNYRLSLCSSDGSVINIVSTCVNGSVGINTILVISPGVRSITNFLLSDTFTADGRTVNMTGVYTNFLIELKVGDAINVAGFISEVVNITDRNTLNIIYNHPTGAINVLVKKILTHLLLKKNYGISKFRIDKSGDVCIGIKTLLRTYIYN